MSGGEVVHVDFIQRCECGHARSEHEFEVLGSCGAEVPMGTGFFDANVCRCLCFELADEDPQHFDGYPATEFRGNIDLPSTPEDEL